MTSLTFNNDNHIKIPPRISSQDLEFGINSSIVSSDRMVPESIEYNPLEEADQSVNFEYQ